MCLVMMLVAVPLMANLKMHGPDFHNKEAAVEGPRVRVLLASGVNSVLLEAKGPYRVERYDTGGFLSAGLVGKRYVTHCTDNGLRWGEEFPQIVAFTVVPSAPQTRFFVNGFQYSGTITVGTDRAGQLIVINETPIEDFVKSVLAAKYPRAMSKEAAAALAIIERTRIFAHVMEGLESSRTWDVTASESGYYGYGVTRSACAIDRAVDDTPFMVVQSRNGKVGSADLNLPLGKAMELAQKGCDARRILSQCFPQTTLGLTAEPTHSRVR